ncbi:MAG: spore coat protein CotS family [Clostridiales bacterium]|nr:spore coat protein CotS family [Clostridiales bacterium]
MFEGIYKICEMYGLKTNAVRRGRGSVFCDTNKGMFVVKELEVSEEKLRFEYDIKNYIIQNSNIKTDQYEKTLSSTFIAEYDNKKYVMKRWYPGEELNIRDQGELYLAIKKLAQLHNVIKKVPANIISKKIYVSKEMPTLLRKRTIEMKKVRSYIRDKGCWSDFELQYLKSFSLFYEQAAKAEQLLSKLDYSKLCSEADNKYSICHGSYNQHNVLVCGSDLCIVCFEKSGIGLQIQDLYNFLRKVLEKNDWDLSLASKLLNAYDDEKNISEEEKRILYIMFLYPEKYWKVANYYYNAQKAWISKRSQEKLDSIVEQSNVRNEFLKILEEFCMKPNEVL